MNIGIVCYPTFGGSGVLATELGKYLAKTGHNVHFITYSQPVRLDILESNIYYHEVNVQDYPLFQYQPYELALSSKMVNVTLKYKLDLLHVHYAIPHAYAAFMAKQILKDKGVNIPVITTLHGTDITLVGKNPSYQEAVNFSINHSDVVTSVSQSLKEDTLEIFDIQRHIEVIHNFVDLSLYNRVADCRKNFASENQKIICHISNFREVKRIDNVVDVFYKVQQEVDSVLLMIGEGPEKEKSREQAQKLGILDKVKYLGKTSEIERVLCMSDLFLLPSEKESFGLSALEAMAAGVPVVSSNTGGIPEVNIDGQTGFTADVGDVDRMAKGAIILLQDEEKMSAFSKNARAQAEKFSLDFIGPKYLDLYKNAVSSVKSTV
ncbi:N-acetyl-alpha-D-glucosaminyl L-malate synthase BshA [Owenweeksia hongkongensis DSM 17368]|uniref:N-acetyl-alpha-D-glucosaminyl L-malate synthase BshA n=1 Tax=Owenweeksia hongkongensis (strain DSM 17368 / CIP 108786 / JCM 12287 / NRRL B-23963 / UST20020801) TaxID=926562 RepID=G8R593_OWEHD|nr:N-acetyl-alpha-D-glucosaminyl L-malate synthase BshA [Owenweeksia hongkongensis]AEV32138.1 N-acetyl-alpha-D-glucosaminyl L-malate synthase BshA [Owenweeksia hongkongensis DSM 17368]